MSKPVQFRQSINPDGLTTSQAGRLCGVSINTVVKWCKLGILGHHRLPQGQRRIRYDELRRFCLEMGLILKEVT